MAIDTVARGLYNEVWVILQQLGIDGVPGGGDGGGDMFKADNLAGLANVPTARANLGLGSAATFDSSQFASSSALATKADLVHTHTSASITDFQEAVEDIVGSGLLAGTNVTLSYDDTTGKTTINSSLIGGGGGDVQGPASSTNSELPLFNSTTGKLLKNSGCVPSANGLSLISAANYAAMQTLLGIGAAANHPDAYFAKTSNNLSDLASAVTARTNLGLGAAAVQPLSAFLQPANNLSEIASASTARTNLGLGSSAVHPSTDFANAVHTHVYTDITNFGVGVNNKIAAGTGVTLSYDAGTGITTINASASSGTSTWDPLGLGANISLSNGNRLAYKTASGSTSARGQLGHSTGKWYLEGSSTPGSTSVEFGLISTSGSLSTPVSFTSGNASIKQNGQIFIDATLVATLTTGVPWSNAVGTVYIAIDLSANLIWFKHSGTTSGWNNSSTADPTIGTGGLTIPAGGRPWYPAMTGNASPDGVFLNTGNSAFVGFPPTGFTAWG